ncbi:endonuclease [Aliarcobacter butzleri]|uniref:endonuclease n=1 Tax=Aliarcobacter butzleri TaxID=28197 RepID=UPI003B216C99
MKKSFILLLLLSVSFLQANTFSQSKKILLKQVYFDNQNSFYCNNPYEIKVLDGKEQTLIIEDKLFYTPRNPITKKGNENPRTKRIEWEHIMPAHNFAHHLACWKEGGRKACSKDKTFQTMEADMHNLVPAIGEVNADRSNFRYGADKPKVGQYGKCQMEVDFKAKRAYVRDDIKGDIARIYFYMSDKYNINLSKQERQMLEVWNKQDPVSSWEKIKNQRVEKLQGNGNKFIQ